MAKKYLEVEYEQDGQRYTGTYTVEGGVITVYSSEGGKKVTQVGGVVPAALARRLLAELVGEESRDAPP